MWLLIFITFSAPMEVNKIKILETHWAEESCVNRLKEAIKIGLPVNSNLGCVLLTEVSEANGN